MAQLHKTQTLAPGDLPDASAGAEAEAPAAVGSTAGSTTSSNGTSPRLAEKFDSLPLSPDQYFADVEQDADEMVRRSPTLTARLWRLVIVLGTRVLTWAWSKARRSR